MSVVGQMILSKSTKVVRIKCWGAAGGAGDGGSARGGPGGFVDATFILDVGTVLKVSVGEDGHSATSGSHTPFGGGGPGKFFAGGASGSGGGYTGVFINSVSQANALAIAGGGGGAENGGAAPPRLGGLGGGSTGGAGPSNCTGGSQIAGGNGAFPGTALLGGGSASAPGYVGGGGGYWGGGGCSDSTNSAGGGGSNFIRADGTLTTSSQAPGGSNLPAGSGDADYPGSDGYAPVGQATVTLTTVGPGGRGYAKIWVGGVLTNFGFGGSVATHTIT